MLFSTLPTPPSLLSCLRTLPVAVVDVETTGASPRWGDRITEIGIVRYEAGQVTRRWEALVDPKRPISPGVQALTGITQEMVDGQPVFAQRVEEITGMLRGAVVVGHNIRFDLGFLASEFRRAKTTLTAALSNPDPPHVLDTVRIARRRFGRGGNSLQILSRRLGVVPTVAHRALPDAETTGQVLERLLEPQGGFGCLLCDALAAQGGTLKLEARPVNDLEDLPMEILDAIEAGGTVKMVYLDAHSRQSERLVLPVRLRRFRGTATLVAHCQLRNEQRTFKLDRIVSLNRLETEAGSPPVEAAPDGRY